MSNTHPKNIIWLGISKNECFFKKLAKNITIFFKKKEKVYVNINKKKCNQLIVNYLKKNNERKYV